MDGAITGSPWSAVKRLNIEHDKADQSGALVPPDSSILGWSCSPFLTLAFPSLQHLTLCRLHIKGSSLFPALAASTKLHTLELQQLQLDEAAARSFTALSLSSSLQSLAVWFVRIGDTRQDIAPLPKLPPTLTALKNGTYDEGLQGAWLASISTSHAPKLHVVRDSISTNSLPQAPWQHMTALHTLQLPYVTCDQAGLDTILQHLTALHTLEVWSFEGLTQDRSSAPCNWRKLTLEAEDGQGIKQAAMYLPLHSLQQLTAYDLSYGWLVFYPAEISSEEVHTMVSKGAANLARSPGARALLQRGGLPVFMWSDMEHSSLQAELAVLGALAPLGTCRLSGLSVELGFREISSAHIQALHHALGACVTALHIGNACNAYTVQPDVWPALCATLPVLERINCDWEHLGSPAAAGGALVAFCMQAKRPIRVVVDKASEGTLQELQAIARSNGARLVQLQQGCPPSVDG